MSRSIKVILGLAGRQRDVKVQAATLWPLQRRGSWISEERMTVQPGEPMPLQDNWLETALFPSALLSFLLLVKHNFCTPDQAGKRRKRTCPSMGQSSLASSGMPGALTRSVCRQLT